MPPTVKWFVAAQGLTETMIAHFQAPEGGSFDTSDDHETLITRPRDLQDNATPSGNAMATTVLLELAGLTNDRRYVDIAHQALVQMESMMAQYPLGFGQWLQALSYTLAKPKEIAIIGEHHRADTRAMLQVVAEHYQPFQIIAIGDPNTRTPVIPLLQDRRQIDGRATAYVCVGFPVDLLSLIPRRFVPFWKVREPRASASSDRIRYETRCQRKSRRIGLCKTLRTDEL